MKKIEKFMLPEHTNKLYTEEAISSVSLTRDIAKKINELIDSYNKLAEIDLTWKHEQEGRIRKGVLYMKDNLLNSLNELMQIYGEDENLKSIMLSLYREMLDATNTPVTPEMFGAIGDGVNDDTKAILNALNHCYETGVSLELLSKTYLIDDIVITHPVTVNFNNGTLKRKAESKTNYCVLNVESDNVVLNNPHLIGDRVEHVGTTGEWGHCLRIGGNNVVVNNGLYENAWGDGVYIYGATNVQLNGVHKAYKCSRNGLAIVKGEHINIDTFIAEYIDRTAPMCAIDIECNNSDENTAHIHINHIISKHNDKAFSIVCRGNKIDDIVVKEITSINSFTSPVVFTYSEIDDKLGSAKNNNSFVTLGSVSIDKSNGCGVLFTRWNIERCPYVNIENVRINNFVSNDETISTGLIGFMCDRNYNHIINYGNFNVNVDVEMFNVANIAMMLNRQNSGYKEDAILNNVSIKSLTNGLGAPTLSFNNVNNVSFFYHSFTNDSEVITNGFNYVKTTKPSFRAYLSEFVLHIGVTHITLDIHNTVKGKVFVNDVEYNNKPIYNMKNKVVYGFKRGENLYLYFDQTSRTWATTNASSQIEPVDGQTIFATSVMKPAWYYSGKWYLADGSEISL